MTQLHCLSSAFLKSANPGKYSDGSGLWFHKRDNKRAQWILRFVLHKRRREMGLGVYPAIGLKEARDQAMKW